MIAWTKTNHIMTTTSPMCLQIKLQFSFWWSFVHLETSQKSSKDTFYLLLVVSDSFERSLLLSTRIDSNLDFCGDRGVLLRFISPMAGTEIRTRDLSNSLVFLFRFVNLSHSCLRLHLKLKGFVLSPAASLSGDLPANYQGLKPGFPSSFACKDNWQYQTTLRILESLLIGSRQDVSGCCFFCSGRLFCP